MFLISLAILNIAQLTVKLNLVEPCSSPTQGYFPTSRAAQNYDLGLSAAANADAADAAAAAAADA